MLSYTAQGASPILLLDYWKPITGYESYEVSITGNVRVVKSMQPKKLRKEKRGYYDVQLSKPGDGGWTVLVHKLVAAEFIGSRPDGLQINHKDGWKWNRRASNLEYITRRDNMDHALRFGLVKSKLSGDQRLQIVFNPEKLHNAALARKFGVHESLVSRIRKQACLVPEPYPARPKKERVLKGRGVKLKDGDAARIRLLASTMRVDDIASMYNVNRSNIYQILRGDIWVAA